MEDRTICSKVAFHFKNYIWALSEFRVTTMLLAVLPLSFHVHVFLTTYILQSSGSQNATHGVCWDHYQQLAKNAKGRISLMSGISHIPTHFLTTPYLVWQRQEHPFANKDFAKCFPAP